MTLQSAEDLYSTFLITMFTGNMNRARDTLALIHARDKEVVLSEQEWVDQVRLKFRADKGDEGHRYWEGYFSAIDDVEMAMKQRAERLGGEE